MATFETFNLGNVIATAEAIKGARRQSKLDELRETALRQNIDLQGQQAKQAQTQFSEKQRLDNTQWLVNASDQVLAIEDPAQQTQTVRTLAEEAKRRGIIPADTDLSQINMEGIAKINRDAKLALGSAPQMESIRDESGALLQRDPRTGEMKQVVAPQKPDNFAAAEAGRNARAAMKPQSVFRAMNPQEVAAAGLPVGSSAQIDEATGKIDVLSKRDTTASLSQKDATTAKLKLNTVKLARQQLNNIRERFEPLKNSMSAGPFGQGKTPTEAGRAFDRSVDQMRSTLTALTRVPGVGAMSDYETKLDQSKFPTREEYESVTQQQIDDLDNMLNAIETGYSDLLSGGESTKPEPGGLPVGQATTINGFTIKRVK